MTTFEDCKQEIAKKYDLGYTLVTGHRHKYWTEAAELYAKKHAIECMNWRDENIYPLASESISNEQIYERFLKKV